MRKRARRLTKAERAYNEQLWKVVELEWARDDISRKLRHELRLLRQLEGPETAR